MRVSLAFDADGPGPESPEVLVGGSFTVAGSAIVNGLARWDGRSWRAAGNGVRTIVESLTSWDPDGPGPSARALVAGGSFNTVGGAIGNCVARWDGSAWSPMGTGMSGGLRPVVSALAAWDPDGLGPAREQLIAAGKFTSAGGVAVTNIARFDGLVWQPLGAGLAGNGVYALATFDRDGDSGPELPQLIAGGEFNLPGSPTVGPNIAAWNGLLWQPLAGSADAPVRALASFDVDGGPGPAPPILVAGGDFSTIGSAPFARVAGWTGSAWLPIGSGFDAPVRALSVQRDPSAAPEAYRLFAGGDFANSGQVAASRLASWNGSSWNAMGPGASATVRSLTPFDPDTTLGPLPESLIIGGDFDAAGGLGVGNIVSWTDGFWRLLGSGLNGPIWCMTSHDPDADTGPLPPLLIAGGDFTTATVPTANRVASWDGLEWKALGGGLDGQVSAAASVDPDGAAGPALPQLFVGGAFTAASGITINRIARWDGAAWQSLGTGIPGSPGTTFVRAMIPWDPDGPGPLSASLVAGGSFSTAGGVSAGNIARWDGSSWLAFGAGMNSAVYALTVFDPDGSGAEPERLVAGGNFTVAGGSNAQGVAQWVNGAWQPLGSGTNNIVLALLPFDADQSGPGLSKLIAAGGFTNAGGAAALRVASWDGTAWQPVGGGMNLFNVGGLGSFDPDGSGAQTPLLIAGGSFTHAEGRPMGHLAKWDGSSWQSFGVGMSNQVNAVAVFDPDGAGAAPSRLCVGGYFVTADGTPSPYLAQWGRNSVLWADSTSGALHDNARWVCGVAPTPFDHVEFDNTRANYPDAALDVQLRSAGAPLTAVSLRVRTDAVTLDLNANAMTLVGGTNTFDEPGIAVGGLESKNASLEIVNSAEGAPAELSASALAVAEQSNSVPRVAALRVSGASARLSINGPTTIARRGNSGSLRVDSGATATLAGTLSVADQLGSVGKVEVTGAGSTILYGGINTSAGIGVNGAATLDISAGGLFASAPSVDILTVGTLTGATVNATIAGAGSTWSTDQKYAFFGYAGDVVFGITNAGQLLTTTSGDVYVSRFAESLSTLTLRDAGSRWREATSPIRIGPSGTIDVGPGAAVECPSLIVTGGGLLTGTGEVRGLTGGAIIPINNGGTISPRSTSGGVGVLTLQGNLTMSALRDGVTTAGTIAADLAGTSPGAYDRIDLTGSATLSGALRVRLTSGFDPPVGSRFTVLTAANGISGRFDVAYFPGLTGRFFRIDYVTGAQRVVTSVDVVVESQSARGAFDPNDYSAPGAPSGADLGDLNADTFPDLVLTIPDAGNPEANPGQVAVLINAGNSGPAWNGFVPSSQVTFNTGRNPQEVVIARLRGNAQPPDLAVACAADNTVQTFSNSGLAVFSPAGTFSSGGLRPLDIDAADFTGDGVADLAVTNYGDINPPPEQQLPDRGNARILNNNGTGSFTPADTLTTGWYPLSLALADLNADGRTDLATADSGTSEVSVFMRPTGGGPGWTPRHTYPTSAPPATVEPGGLDNPKDLNDLAIVTTPAVATIPSIGVLLNLDDGSGDLAPVVNLDVGGFSRGLAPVDLDDDGDQDLAVIVQGASPSSSSVRLLRNNTPPNSPGGVTLALEPTPLATNNPALILAGDVNTDGVEDLVTINTDTVLLRAGGSAGDTNDSPSAAPARDGPDRGSKSPQRVTVALASAPPPACVGDFNGDNQVGTPDLVYLIGRFGQTFQPPGSEPADLNADGVVSTPDLVAFIGRFGSACP
ncbi:MAG: hypothetical protein J0L61_06995 [Planctomycetes bacterium]|nr:hypothetical protein [Planctomycetota bacterium]